MKMQNKKVIVTLSGGADSAVLLYKAAELFKEVHTITFDYGQRHTRELVSAKKQLLNAKHNFPNVTFTNKLLDVKYISILRRSSKSIRDLVRSCSSRQFSWVLGFVK